MKKQKIKQIAEPAIKSGRQLSALELNRIPYREQHSVLTPQQLETMSEPQTQP